jgi:acyl-CoA oxidase
LLPEIQRFALETRLAHLVQQHIADTDNGLDTSFSSHALTMAHGDFVYFSSLQDVVDRLSKESSRPEYLATVQSMSNVFALSVLQNAHHSSLAYAISVSLPAPASKLSKTLSALRSAYDSALKNFVEEGHAEKLVDSWGLTEYEMDSALARASESPYEALWEGAKASEMSGDGMKDVRPTIVSARGLWKEIQGKSKL